jgi:phospholipase/carboxylesterase
MHIPAIDSSAVLWSVPREKVAHQLADRPLLLMMHGYGSHEGDLFPLAQYLPEDFVVASIRAPLNLGMGHAWFNIIFDDANNTLRRDPEEVNQSTEQLIAWIDDLEREVGELNRISLLGFSQGGVMMTQLLRYQPHRYDAGVLLAGFALLDTSNEAKERDKILSEVKPPVFWGRDPQDPVITTDLIDFTRRWLPEHTDLDARLYGNVGHSLSLEELQDVNLFLSDIAL